MTTHASETGQQSAKDRAAEVGSTAKEQTGNVAGSAKEQAVNVAGTAKEQAVDVAHEAADQARNLIDELRTNVRDQVGTQRDKLAQTLDQYATELRQMAERSESDGPATEAVRQVATKLQDMKSYLDGGGDVATDVRRFARRRPGLFLLGCAAVGVVAGRATRGAAAARSQDQDGSGRHGTGTSGASEWRRPYDGDEHGTDQYASGQHAGQYTGQDTELGGAQFGAAPGGAAQYGTQQYANGGATSPGVQGYAAPDTGLDRTSDPNLRPTSGPLVTRESAYGGQSDSGDRAYAAAGDPVPPDLNPGDTAVDRALTDSGTAPRTDGTWERGER